MRSFCATVNNTLLRRSPVRQENKPKARIVFHLLTVCPTHFSLNGHHEGS